MSPTNPRAGITAIVPAGIRQRIPPILLAQAKKRIQERLLLSSGGGGAQAAAGFLSSAIAGVLAQTVAAQLEVGAPLEAPDNNDPKIQELIKIGRGGGNAKSILALLLYVAKSATGYSVYFWIWDRVKSMTVAQLLKQSLPSSSSSSTTTTSQYRLDILRARIRFFLQNFVGAMACGILYKIFTSPFSWLILQLIGRKYIPNKTTKKISGSSAACRLSDKDQDQDEISASTATSTPSSTYAAHNRILYNTVDDFKQACLGSAKGAVISLAILQQGVFLRDNWIKTT